MNDAIEPSGETRRLLSLALVVFGALLALHFTPLNTWMDDLRSLKSSIQGYGWKAYAGFWAASVAAIAVGVPRLALCAVAGVLFGFVAGSLVALCAGVMGSYGAFLLARWGGRDWAERRLSTASESLRKLLATPSVGSIFVARQLPVPGIVLNVLIGMLPTTHQTFLIGTGLGYLPSTAIVCLAGSSLGKESLTVAMTQVSLAMIGLGAFSALLMWLRHWLTSRGE